MKSISFRVTFIIMMILCWLLLLLSSIIVVDAKPKRISSYTLRSPHRFLQSSSSFTNSITKLTASNEGKDNFFGSYRGVSISNNRIVVGAYGHDAARGAAYLFGDPNDPQFGQSYSELAIFTNSDGEIGDWFGYSVAIDENIVVVGAVEYHSNGTGAAYVHRIADDNNNVTISQVAKLMASNGLEFDCFGTSVAIYGKYILIGANGVNKNDSRHVGSAYLFGNLSNDPNTTPEWTQLQQFQPDDLAGYHDFGFSVALDENIAVIGTYESSANAAYVFAPVNSDGSSSLSSSWTQSAKLTGSINSLFGNAVAVAGNWIIVSAYSDNNINGIDAGAVFVFTKTSSTWTQVAQLLASDGAAGDRFGISVSISKDASTVVVGADYKDYDSTITDSGAMYLFRMIESSTTTTMVEWTQMGKFVASDPAMEDYLGSSVAIENNIVVVGAPVDDSASGIANTGSAYVLDIEFLSRTAAPTAEQTPTATPGPILLSPTPKPTNPPTPVAPSPVIDDSSPPRPMNTNPPTSTTVQVPPHTPPPNDDDSKTALSPGVMVGICAILVVGLIVGGAAALIAILNYRLKREAREQQQQQTINTGDDAILPLPPPVSASNTPTTANAADDENETPILVDVVIMPPEQRAVQDRTMEADAFLDPTTRAAAAAIASLTRKELPRFKDQVRTVEPPGRSTKMSPESAPKKKSQHREQDHPNQQQLHPEPLEDYSPPLPMQQHPNQGQLHHPDPPAATATNWQLQYQHQQQHVPSYKDQVAP
jgi:hypothetical protein